MSCIKNLFVKSKENQNRNLTNDQKEKGRKGPIKSLLIFFFQFHLLILRWFWIGLHNLFRFVFYKVIAILNKILIFDWRVKVYFCYHIIKWKKKDWKNSVEFNEVHNQDHGLGELSREARSIQYVTVLILKKRCHL